jgi:hypothetical protein
MTELEFLDHVKSKLEPVEVQAFHRRIISLQSNLTYWSNRQSHEKASERQEAKEEFRRCEQLLVAVMKDMRKKDKE